MEYDERRVIEETIYKYHSKLLTQRERELSLAFLARAKGEAYQKPSFIAPSRPPGVSSGDVRSGGANAVYWSSGEGGTVLNTSYFGTTSRPAVSNRL